MTTLNAVEFKDSDVLFERKIRDATEGLLPECFNWLYNKIASGNKENAHNPSFNKHEMDIQSSQQSVRYKLVAKNITLQIIKQREIMIISVNQLDIPVGLKQLIISHGFTVDLLLGSRSTDLSQALGIDNDVAKMIINAAKKYVKGSSV